MVIDEAQYIQNVGHILKILVDMCPQIQIIATGSSSFDLVNKGGEPLTGRSRQFVMMPFAVSELYNDAITAQSMLEKIMVFGLYPSVISKTDSSEAIVELENITSGYLYRDVLAFESLKHSEKIINLLQMLALQVGSEVSYTEIGASLGIDKATVEKYLDLLEKCFVIFKLRPFSRNLRKEINRRCKIYFYDLGVRNCLINNYNPLNLRNDIEALWENFCIVEKMKYNQIRGINPSRYFWRYYNGQEIDYLEEYGGQFNAYEFKYSSNRRVNVPKVFNETYKPAGFNVITSDNWYEYFMKF